MFITFLELSERLKEISDRAWGFYAFSRDPVGVKLDSKEKERLIENAIACGYEKAEEYLAAAQIAAGSFQAPSQLAEFLDFKVEDGEEGRLGIRILFAAFLPPDTIRIMKEPLETAFSRHFSETVLSLPEVSSLLLGHEIFHGIEERDKNIDTRCQRILKKKILGIKFYAPIDAVSEIAAMYFAQKITGLPYSPFALDILLYYNYNIMEALRMYEEVSGYLL